MSEFVERDLLNGYDPDYEPSRKGLDQLKASASYDFGALQLDTLVKEIRKLHSGPITIVDLRNETHGLINGYHVSIYGKQNWANIGLSRETILAEEADLIHNTVGQQLSTVVLDKATTISPLIPSNLTLRRPKPRPKPEPNAVWAICD